METIRDFIVRTLLRDEATNGIDKILDKATALTGQPYKIAFEAATEQAERALVDIQKQAKKASEVNFEQSKKGLKNNDEAAKGLLDRFTLLGNQSTKLSNSIGGFFQRLDAGKVLVAGAAAGLMVYAKNALQVAESIRLSGDMIKSQLGAQAGATLSFIDQGQGALGASKSSRSSLAGYMAMTGYKDSGVIQKNISNAESIMSSTWGQSLAGFGVQDEKGLLQALSNPMDETSDLGRIIKDKMPNYFKAATLQTEMQKVRNEPGGKYQFVGENVVEAEARRRMASQALEQISSEVEPDKDSYRVGMKQLTRGFEDLNAGIGDALRPAAGTILSFLNILIRLLSAAPEIPAMAAAVLGLGTALSVLGTVLPLLKSGMQAFTTAMKANPLGLVLVAATLLIIGLSALEARFHVFSKAWDRFKDSVIGQDLINGVKSLLGVFGILGEGDMMGGLGKWVERIAGAVGGLFDQVDSIYSKLKGGDLGGALKGGIGLMFSMSPLGIAAGVLEGTSPMRRFVEWSYYILQKIKGIWDGLISWISAKWDYLLKALDPLIRLFNLVKEIKEYFLGKSTGAIKDDTALAKALKEYITGESGKKAADSSYATPFSGNLSQEALDYLTHKGVNPEDKLYKNKETNEQKWMSSPPDMSKWRETTPIGATGSAVAEAIRKAKELREGTKTPGALTNPVEKFVEPFVEKRKEAVADTLSTGSNKIDEAIAKGSYVDLKKAETSTYWDMWSSVLFGSGTKPTEAPAGASDWETQAGALAGAGLARGGKALSDGWVKIHQDEPVIPARISNNAGLIDTLERVAAGSGSGGSGGSGEGVTIQIDKIEVIASSGNAGDIARNIKQSLLDALDDFTFKAKVEAIIQRSNKGLTGASS